jgi:acyl-CoA synthetase (AMP-forming)/AMP-acid ligase II
VASSEDFIVIGDSGEESRFSFAAPPGQDAWLAQIDIVFQGASRIGLIAPTSLAGILCWRAILLSGRTPIFLHFPTAKLSRSYWRSEIEAAVTSLSIEGIVHQGDIADPGLPLPRLDLISPVPERSFRKITEFMRGSVVQLSSGTTGFRKGVGLAMADISRHVENYGQVLGLTEADCIVSWLPLYHDMGFIACFLMPVLAGARIVMVDPMAWMRRPLLLFELIERYRGTICFMPNFGFQVMASRCRGHALDLSSMRHWISCSEPTRIETMHRFMESSGAAPERLSNCYAMAENIFAVCQSRGLHTERIGGAELVSCGTTIPSTSIKIVEGEVHVRSPYSLQAYDGGQSIVDGEGYYATGDLGEIIDGALYLLGRKRDLLIQAGRKFLLSDLDHEVGKLVPESAGRICVVERYNEALGTDEPVCLIEHPGSGPKCAISRSSHRSGAAWASRRSRSSSCRPVS